MINTRARQQLNTIIDAIQQAEIKELEQQRKKLAAYTDSHKADMEEDTDMATAIRDLNNYLSDRAEAYITRMNRIGKLLTGRDAVSDFIAVNGLPYVECGGCEKAEKIFQFGRSIHYPLMRPLCILRLGGINCGKS